MQAPRVARSSRTLSLIVIGSLGISALIDLVSIVHELAGKTLLERYVEGTIGDADLVAWDSTFATIALGQTVIFILTAIVWLAWQYRMVQSVEPLTHDAPVKTPGRSVLWWFVPFANLVVVPRIYNDLKDKLTRSTASLVGWWWGSYLVANTVTNLAGRIWAGVDTAEGFTSGLNFWIAADVLNIAAAVAAVRLIRVLQAGQDALIAAPTAPIAINTLATAAAPVETPG